MQHEILDVDREWVTSVCQYSKPFRDALLDLVRLTGWRAREIDDIVWDEFYAARRAGRETLAAVVARALRDSFVMSNKIRRIA